ncbi:NADPH:quinone reductase [uncultured Gammaproteobacteria bacterium]
MTMMMKAMVIDQFGGSDRLHPVELPVPKPAANEVLIKLAYTAVNPVDWKIREGWLNSLFPHEFPLIPGWDAAGTVAAVGEAVTAFVPGNRVFAYCRKPLVRWGTYAGYVTMAATAVAPMPSTISFAQAGAIPLVGLTAWQSLFDAAGLGAGQTVLIHGGAGGIGSLAIQFAKHAGACVITTASVRNHDYVRALGADVAIDYRSTDFVAATRAAAPQGVDVAFDTVGGAVLKETWLTLKPGGFLVGVVDVPDGAEAQRHGVRCGHVFVSPNGRQLAQIGSLIDGGRVQPSEITEMALDDAAAAQDVSRSGHVRGKIVLRID